jgi:hypothetical protein
MRLPEDGREFGVLQLALQPEARRSEHAGRPGRRKSPVVTLISIQLEAARSVSISALRNAVSSGSSAPRRRPGLAGTR